MPKEKKEKEYKLSKQVVVTKEEYIASIKSSAEHWEKMADKEISERIEKYIKRMEKQKAEYLRYAAKYRNELAKIEKEE